jgi:carbamoyl-phosphate synthase large subunit
MGAGNRLPTKGKVFISIKDSVKDQILPVAKKLYELGFEIIATKGTHKFLNDNNIPAQLILKVQEGRPNIVDLIKNREVNFIINVPEGKKSRLDADSMRRAMLNYNIPFVTTVEAAEASVNGIKQYLETGITVKSIQEYYK